MTPLVGFQQEQAARLLIAHLNAQGIRANYRKAGDAHEVVLAYAEDTEKATLLTRTFLNNPHAKEYQSNAWDLGEQVEKSGSLNLTFPALAEWIKAPFTMLVAVTCSLVFFFMTFGGFSWVREWLFIAPLNELFQSHQYWRVFTPNVIHFSFLHFIFNTLWWLMLGSQIERRLGLSAIIMIFILASITSNIAQLLMSGPNFGGLSGIVYAVLGFVWWAGWLRPDWQLQVSKPIVGFMLVWLLVGFADVLWISMANTAHLVGLISGCLIAAGLAKLLPK
ncbi:rhomboid family intramembrane serine protease GlpG [Alteromonas flava]|uniref:rhomboid family intramembrane serine protease GlpG n=1 Tax=Alteromonas flava TaxID=2048003 RepID=UPI000C287181|nr:rhomboid family intramembrane serine protease GlpG [Alteromonas flava]